MIQNSEFEAKIYIYVIHVHYKYQFNIYNAPVWPNIYMAHAAALVGVHCRAHLEVKLPELGRP